MRMEIVSVVALSLLTAACGSGGDRGTVTGGLTGAGALVSEDAGKSVAADAGLGAAEGSGPSHSSAHFVRRAQSELKREGLYESKVDGIDGPQTRQGIAAFQQAEGLQQTARLDRATRDRMTVKALRMDGAFFARAKTDAAIAGSGSSRPPRTGGTSTVTDANPPTDRTDGIGASR
jgi:peptidoglycan hydrolase-like protein with peptidoglycan-binding domain